MNYTTNYHLPQWVEEDRISMEDFNQMCEGIDEGLTEIKTEAEDKGYVIGSYVGNGGTQTIGLGFRPSFLFIGSSNSATSSRNPLQHGIFCSGTSVPLMLSIKNTGFEVTDTSDADTYSNPYPLINQNYSTYHYLAFR